MTVFSRFEAETSSFRTRFRCPALVALLCAPVLGLAADVQLAYTQSINFGEGTASSPAGVVLTPEQEVVVAGSVTGVVQGQPSNCTQQAFLARYTPGGVGLRSMLWGTNDITTPASIAIAPNGAIAIAGLESGSGQTNGFLAAFTPAWSNIFYVVAETGGASEFRSVAFDDEGCLYVAGCVSGAFAGQTNSGANDGLLAKFNPAGQLVWGRLWGGANDDYGQAVSCTGTNLFTGGSSSTGYTWETCSYLFKYDVQGNLLWSQSNAQYRATACLVASSNGGVYVVRTGFFLGDFFEIARHGPDGQVIWTNFFEGNRFVSSSSPRLVLALDGSPTLAYLYSYSPGQMGQGYSDHCYRRYSASGELVGDWASRYWWNYSVPGPRGLTIGARHEAYVVSDYGNAELRKFREGINSVAALNNFSGTGRSDMTVFDPSSGCWYGANATNASVSLWGYQCAAGGQQPVPGDYDGDSIADVAAFDPAEARWYIAKPVEGRSINIIAWAVPWGWAGATVVPGDYDGDGIYDLAVHDEVSGCWYIMSLTRGIIAWNVLWGFPGAQPVPGDYDGDGKWDLAVYDAASGSWFVYSLTRGVWVWGYSWGYAGTKAVSGDYDGDGVSDFCIYDPSRCLWYGSSMAPKAEFRNDLAWGFPGGVPVSGDFDGDSATDAAIYDPASGAWFIYSFARDTIIAWNVQWGFPGAIPVGAAQ